MSRPRVFVVHEPLKRNPATGELERTKDLRPAAEYGELVHLLPQGARLDPEPALAAIAEGLAGYTADDYLLFTGAPELIAMAGAVASHVTGGPVRWLSWDRIGRRYTPSPLLDLRPRTANDDLARARRLLAEDAGEE